MKLGDLKEIKISSDMIYQGKILNLRVDTVQLPNGNESKREVVEYTGAVAIVAITGKREIMLVRQYRYPAEREFIEIPAGKLEPGEKPLGCAKRELVEETGAKAGEWKQLFSFYSTPGFSNEEMHVFLALNLEFQEQNLDDDEFVEVERVPFQKALEMVRAGDINDAKTIVGILGAQDMLK